VFKPIAAALLEQQAGVLHQHMVQMDREHRAHSQLQQQMQQQMQQQLQYQQMQMERQQQQMQDVMNGLLAQIRGIQALGGALALAAQPAAAQPAAAPPAAALPAAAAGAAAAPPAPAPQEQQLAGAAAGRRPFWEPY